MAATITSCTCPARWSARWSAIIIPFVTGLKLPDITFVEAEREAEHSRRENTDNRFFTNSFIISFAPWSLLQVESNSTMFLNQVFVDCATCGKRLTAAAAPVPRLVRSRLESNQPPTNKSPTPSPALLDCRAAEMVG